MNSFLPKELVSNILLHVDLKTIVNFTSTNTSFYDIRNDIYLFQNKYNVDVNLWNEICKNKHKPYYDFWSDLSKNIDCTTLIKFFQLTCDGWVKCSIFYGNVDFGPSTTIDFFDMLTYSPLWSYYCVYKINNWNNRCLFRYKKGVYKYNQCPNKSIYGKYVCHNCIRRPSNTLYNDKKLFDIYQQMSVVDLKNYQYSSL